ncbi:sigma-54-dependent transcriptional regulator [Oleidesulfovibrio alaskensis]|uniref:sigma-54-dependent transcriptional regulator n=1 Tax=Oleidesulfovibrio alaskensis TaxID=58180 RepID=UPI00048758E1|nr:sigma-54 dependent transcriptional regulator [Oleidesulfovibrio alaskensis]
MAQILLVDADSCFAHMLGAIIEGLGHRVHHAASLREGRALAAAAETDVVYLHVQLPDGSGTTAVESFRSAPGRPEVVLLTDRGDPDTAEEAIRMGVWEYVEKSSPADRIILPLLRALDYRGRRPSRRSTASLKRDDIIGSSRALQKCLDTVSEAAFSDASVLLFGETGAGKEVFARAIHDNSHRAGGPFVAVDCASLTRTLAGSILFGHRKGAFTGAEQNKDGLVLQAHRGTLFLDEVGELPLSMQKLFLRVLQEHRFRPVGGRNEVTSDFRLIAATNRDLEKMVSQGTFRSDLLYRMRTIVMHLPPLRSRTEDITELADHYLQRMCGKYGVPHKSMAPDLQETLRAYAWPGNVRELIHTLERAVLAAQDEPRLFARHLPDHVRISTARAALQQRRTDSTAVAQPSRDEDTASGAPESRPQAPRPCHTCGTLPESYGTPAVQPESTDQDLPHLHDTAGHNAAVPQEKHPLSPDHSPLPPFFTFRDNMFRDYLRELLRRTDNDIAAACAMSGLSRSYLYDLLRRHGLRNGGTTSGS